MTQDDFFNEVAELIKAEWRKDAECKDVWPEIFFQSEYTDYAKTICDRCPVRLECLNASINKKDKYIRGGYTEQERQAFVNHQNRYNQYFEFDLDAKKKMQTL